MRQNGIKFHAQNFFSVPEKSWQKKFKWKMCHKWAQTQLTSLRPLYMDRKVFLVGKDIFCVLFQHYKALQIVSTRWHATGGNLPCGPVLPARARNNVGLQWAPCLDIATRAGWQLRFFSNLTETGMPVMLTTKAGLFQTEVQSLARFTYTC